MRTLCLLLLPLFLTTPLSAQDWSGKYDPTEHAEISRLVHELDYMLKETQAVQQRYRNDAVLLEFNYQRLIDLLSAQRDDIRAFLNLKYAVPGLPAVPDLHSVAETAP